MNMCFVADGFGIGGLERVVTLIGESLNTEYYSVYYFSIENTKPYWTIQDPNHLMIQKRRYDKIIKLNMKGLKLLECVVNRGTYDVNRYQKYFISNIIDYVLKNKISVLVLTSAHQIAAIPQIKKAIPNLKIIAWIHQSYTAIIENSSKFHTYFISGIKVADKVVCLTDETTNSFKKINKNSLKIYNPITFEKSDKYSDLSDSNISFVSRISFGKGEKGLDILLNIATELPENIKVNLAGGGTKKDEKLFQKMIKRRGLKDKINWHGAKKGQDLINHYLNSSIFISTSRTEGFSLVILEAMSLGLPIISSSTTGARELLKNGSYGVLIDSLDSNQFVDKIKELIADKDELLKLQKLSLTRSKDFNRQNVVTSWLNLLRDLLYKGQL